MGKENQKHCVFGRRIDRRNGLDFHCIKKSSFLYSRPCNLDLFYLNLSITSSLNLTLFCTIHDSDPDTLDFSFRRQVKTWNVRMRQTSDREYGRRQLNLRITQYNLNILISYKQLARL